MSATTKARAARFITKTAHFVPAYLDRGSQEEKYGMGYSRFVDQFRANQVSGIKEVSDNIRRLEEVEEGTIITKMKK